jgi:predicted transcriptional regulator
METQPRTLSVHIPVALLSFAIAIFLFSQIGAASRTSDTIKWQLENGEKGLAQIKDAQKQFADSAPKRDELVKQSTAVQEQYTKLLNDVMDLAKTDKDAQTVVEKWKIQRNETAPATDATKPAGETKPAEPKK